MIASTDELYEWAKKFCRVRRSEPRKLVFDGFSGEFCLVLDFEDDPETPEAHGTCDILTELLPHRCEDYKASRIRLLANANKADVMRVFAALKLRWDSVIKPN